MHDTPISKACMQELEDLRRTRDVEFDAVDRHIMDFPHTIHLCVTQVLKSFTDTDLATIAGAWTEAFPDEGEREMYIEAVRSDPIARGHDIIRAIRASGLRREEFMNAIKTGNLEGWFKGPAGEVEQVPELELLDDAKPHWDSYCIMVNRLRGARLVRSPHTTALVS